MFIHIIKKGDFLVGDQLLGDLSGQFRRLRTMYLLYLLAAVAALICFFFNKAATLVILGASLVCHFALIRPRAKAYEAAYTHACIQLTMQRRLENAVHTPETVLKEETLRCVRLIPDNDSRGSILLREGVSATFRGRPVLLGDATFAHSFPAAGKTCHEFVVGCWAAVELNEDSGMDWRLLSPGVVGDAARRAFLEKNPDLKPLSWDENGFEGCLILRPEGTPDLPPKSARSILKRLLEREYDHPAVCIRGRELHVMLVNRVLGQKASVRIPPSKALLERDLLPELDDVLALAKALDEQK